MDRPVEPKPIVAAFSAAIDSNFFLWGGDEASDDLSHVHVFGSSSGAWTAKQTTGTPPPGYSSGASTSVGDIMYTYGGRDHHKKDTGCLCELNSKTLVWQLLSQEGPMKKRGCAMAAIKERLILFGGSTSSPGEIQPGSQCVKNDIGGYCLNEVHVYNLKTSVWSSPAMSGNKPPPCDGCTLTAIDPYTLLMFGGYTGKKDMKDLYIMDFAAMEWRKKSSTLFRAWPAARSEHSATHLSFDEDHQMLLVIGGLNKRTYSDVWLLDLKTWRWSEISSESESTWRYYHSAGVIRSSPHLVEVLLFGGIRDILTTADTSVLKFERPQSGAASKQKVFLSKILDLQSLTHRGEENRRQAALLVEVDAESAESALLKHYPPLPVVQSTEPAIVPSGFSMEKEISVTYQGEKGYVMWKEAGLQLVFEEDKDLLLQAAIKCSVQVSESEGSYARLPSKTEVVSPVFHISSSQKLNTSATVKIFHQASDVDIDQLHFLTSTDNLPPYDYQIVQGGHFTSTYGEISVQHFSFYTICQLGFHYGVKGVLSYMETRYEASLYCSSRPKLVKSGHTWNIYLSVVKNCDVFSHSVKNYIKEKHQEDVILVTGQVLRFDTFNKLVTAHHHFDPTSAADVTLIEPSCKSLKRNDIKQYVGGRPPLLEYSLHSKSLYPLELKITLEGFEEETTFTLRDIHLPDPKTSIAAAALSANTIDSGTQEPIFALTNLTLLKADPPLRLIEVLSPDWEKAAHLLGMNHYRVDIIARDHSRSVEDCCCALMDHWIYDVHGVYAYPSTWKGMCSLLSDMELCRVAQQLQKFIFNTE